MHISFNSKAMNSAIKMLAMVTEQRHKIPILSYVNIEVDRGKLKLTATDLDIHLTTFVELNSADDDFKAAIPLKPLAAFIGNCGDIPVTITLSDKEKPANSWDKKHPEDLQMTVATMVAGEDDFVIKCEALPHADYPTPPELAFDEIEKFTNGYLGKVLRTVSPAISTEETRYYLNGVHFGNGVAAATDGHRLIEYRFNKEAEYASMIIPRKAISVMQSVSPKEATLFKQQGGERWFKIIAKGRFIMVAKLVDGTYPDYKRVIPPVSKAYEITIEDGLAFRKNLAFIAAINRIERKVSVALTEQDGRIVMTTGDVYTGASADIKTQAKIKSATEKFKVGYNVNYLLSFIKPTGKTEINLSDAGSPTLITNDQEEDVTYVLMPMRV